MTPITTLAFLGLIVAAAGYSALRVRYVRLQREQYIRTYVFPASLLAKLNKEHRHLTEKDHFLVARGLRQFLLVRARTGNALIGMPSKVVDSLWHEFILDTRAYSNFCKHAFGEFFHHVPASSTPKGTDIGLTLHITWRHACLEENINPDRPTRLPLLFAIDQKLAIEGGHRYFPRKQATEEKVSDGGGCGGSACGGRSDYSDADGDGGGDGGCGGGCGGD